MPLLLGAPTLVSSADALRMVADTVSFSKVEEPIALRQHFPETFLWSHVTDLGYLTLHFQHVVRFFSSFASSPRDSIRVKRKGAGRAG